MDIRLIRRLEECIPAAGQDMMKTEDPFARVTNPIVWHRFLRTRRSIRRFLTEPIPDPILTRMIETATWAPSAHNRQPWRFVVLKSRDARARLAQAMAAPFRAALGAEGLDESTINAQVARSQARIDAAPAAVLLCLDSGDLDRYKDQNRDAGERFMGVQSVALAGGVLLLAAHAEGLGGVWMCAPLFVPEPVREALDLPEGWDPQGMILLGYPQSQPAPRDRRPLEEVVRYL